MGRLWSYLRPIILFSLFWKRTTREVQLQVCLPEAVWYSYGICTISRLGGVFAIYELFPAFVLSCIAIVVVSLMTKKPDQAILDEFETAKTYELMPEF